MWHAATPAKGMTAGRPTTALPLVVSRARLILRIIQREVCPEREIRYNLRNLANLFNILVPTRCFPGRLTTRPSPTAAGRRVGQMRVSHVCKSSPQSPFQHKWCLPEHGSPCVLGFTKFTIRACAASFVRGADAQRDLPRVLLVRRVVEMAGIAAR